MKLREIKPGMVIQCENDEERNLLLEELERLGYVWCVSLQRPTEPTSGTIGSMICVYDDMGFKNITHAENKDYVTHKFSDLILPELSAAEVLKIRNQLEFEFVREHLGMSYGQSLDEMLRKATVEEVIDMCEQWKADHEKKAVETEWVDICRIIEIQDNGTKKCVYEEEIIPDEELPYGSEKLKAEEIFKNYIAEHDGNYIAVIEPVLKVKGE